MTHCNKHENPSSHPPGESGSSCSVYSSLSGVAPDCHVFWKGLSVTNLTDLVPWGLWITIDLSSIAIACGAFCLCAGVYLLGLKRYRAGGTHRHLHRSGRLHHGHAGPAARYRPPGPFLARCDLLEQALPALGSDHVRDALPDGAAAGDHADLCLLRMAAHPLAEVALRMENVHHIAPYLAIAGLCLSMLHQSSLGAVYGVLKARPIWYRPDVSVLFIISAVAAGMALTVFASMLSSRVDPACQRQG